MKKVILVIDDDSVMLRLIMSMLRDSYTVAVINAGAQAVSAIHRVHPDAVLLDVLMPDVSGESALRQIRADAELQSVPILMMSGTYDEEFISRLAALGASGFVKKPIDRTQLLSAVAAALDRG